MFQPGYDNSTLLEAIYEHYSDNFKTLKEQFVNPNTGQRYSEKHMYAMKKRLDEIILKNNQIEERATEEGLQTPVSVQWKNFLIYLMAVRCKIVDNCNFFFDYQKNIEYIASSKETTMKIRTDYFKDSLVDWILALLSISSRRVIIFLPNDFSAISYEIAVKEALSFHSDETNNISKLLHLVLEVTATATIPNHAKIIFMSCKTLCRLFVAKEHKELDKCDLFLVDLVNRSSDGSMLEIWSASLLPICVETMSMA